MLTNENGPLILIFILITTAKHFCIILINKTNWDSNGKDHMIVIKLRDHMLFYALNLCTENCGTKKIFQDIEYSFYYSTLHFLVLSSFMTYHWVCNQINTMGATSGAGTAYPPEHPRSPPVYVVVCPVLLFLAFCCLFFFDLRILITPLVSSNSSYIPDEELFSLKMSEQKKIYELFVQVLLADQ